MIEQSNNFFIGNKKYEFSDRDPIFFIDEPEPL
jgi:hypothetical protein